MLSYRQLAVNMTLPPRGGERPIEWAMVGLRAYA
jgi:hypothetical protein